MIIKRNMYLWLLCKCDLVPSTKKIVIKYHYFHGFIMKSDVVIDNVDIKEHTAYTFTKYLDLGLFGYLHYKLNSW